MNTMNATGVLSRCVRLARRISLSVFPARRKPQGDTRIIVWKADRKLSCFVGGRENFSCAVSLGSSPVGPKLSEGDGRTPEGIYKIVTKNARSAYHLALGINYPNAADARRALSEKRISDRVCRAIISADAAGRRPAWDTSLGGYIMLHGEDPKGRTGDWTAGCVAMRNTDIERLYALADIGTEVDIRP